MVNIMQVGIVILDKDTGDALMQDSMDVADMKIEQFLKSINGVWKREVVSAFLVNDGTNVLDLTIEQDILITDIYNKYEFELGYSELWIEVKIGKDIPVNLEKEKKKRIELLLAKVKDARDTFDNALAELEKEEHDKL